MTETLLGTKIGHFRFVSKIAAGGMGEVYEGYDETLQRKVALKGIRPEYHLDGEAKGRFLREARVLSQLGHPNICQIHDYLEGEKADFIVMEFLEGRSLAQAMKKGLDGRVKMRIAEQVAGVLVAAHEKGVIHRDLKPDNVILAEGDQVKVLDFGLSRRLGEEAAPSEAVPVETPPGRPALPDDDLTHGLAIGSGFPSASGSMESLTSAGAIMGTLGYMSPEQARGEMATAASDMYSFGLLLQELFTGRPSYDPRLSPEARLAKARKGDTLPVEGVDGDLAALIGRLESLEPAARPSAVDAAEKLHWIRCKPQRRRRRLLVAAAMAVLAAFGAAMTVLSVRATRAEKRAREEAETSKQVSDFLVNLFSVSDPSEAKGREVTAREILDKGAKKISTELRDEPLVQARLMDTMGGVYMGLGLYQDAEPLLSSALAIRKRALGPEHPDVAASMISLATLYLEEGKYGQAEPLFKGALAIREKALEPDSQDLADALIDLGVLYRNQGKYAEAEPLYIRALAIEEKLLGPDDPEVGVCINNLAIVYFRQGEYAQAEPLYKRSLAIREKALGPDHPYVAACLSNLALLYASQGRYAEAEPLYKRGLAIREKVLGPGHSDVAYSLNNLANLYQNEGRYAEAEPLFKRSLAIWEKALGPDFPEVATGLDNLALLYASQGRCAEAEPLCKRSLVIREKAFGQDNPEVVYSLQSLATVYWTEGRYEEAMPLFARALAIRDKTSGHKSRATAEALRALAACEFGDRRLAAALYHSAQCAEIGRELAVKTPEDQKVRFLTGSALLLKGEIETAMGKGADALSAWKEAFAVLQPIAKHAQGVSDQAAYAQTLLCLGRTDEARPIVNKLMETGYRSPDLLALCREKGLVPKESPRGSKR